MASRRECRNRLGRACVCVKSSNGAIHAVSGGSACAANETAERLATGGDLDVQDARIMKLETQNAALTARVDTLRRSSRA